MFDHISEVDWARAAAFIDGEGNIHIVRRKKRGTHGGHYLCITVTNTDPRLLIWFKKIFGGYIVTADKRRKSNHRTAYRWRVTGDTASEVLRGCMPYLILKREQAEIALDFQSTIMGPAGTITSELYQLREEYKATISAAKWQKYEWSVEV